MVIVSFIFLNLFIAIILSAFASAQTEQNIRINDDIIQAYGDTWMKYDKNATGMILTKNLKDLVLDLCQQEIEFLESKDIKSEDAPKTLFDFSKYR